MGNENQAAKSLMWVCNQIPDDLGDSNEERMLKCIKLYCQQGAKTIKELETNYSNVCDLLTEKNEKIIELERKIQQNGSYARGYADGIKNTYEAVMPEKLKQFAKRLRNYDEFVLRADTDGALFYIDLVEWLDETLKEFISNGNGD